MNIHEYQAKQLLKGFGAPVADGVAIMDAAEAEKAAKSLPGSSSTRVAGSPASRAAAASCQ